MIRLISSILFVAAMLLAPLAMQSGAAMAMPTGHHQSQMMTSGHCDSESSNGQDQDQDKGEAAKSCCVAMCAAAALPVTAAFEAHAFGATVRSPTVQDFRFGYFGELPTPPPRSA